MDEGYPCKRYIFGDNRTRVVFAAMSWHCFKSNNALVVLVNAREFRCSNHHKNENPKYVRMVFYARAVKLDRSQSVHFMSAFGAPLDLHCYFIVLRLRLPTPFPKNPNVKAVFCVCLKKTDRRAISF